MIESTFTTLRNRLCNVTNRDGSVEQYRIHALSDKTGTMKNGTKAPYVVLMNTKGNGVVVNLHPEHAKRLFKKGEDSGIEIIAHSPEEVKPEEVVAPVVEDVKAAEVVVPEVVAVETATATETPATEVSEKAPSKKAMAVELFNKNVGSARKDVIALFISELNMSKLGAATYYQNIKSGQWK